MSEQIKVLHYRQWRTVTKGFVYPESLVQMLSVDISEEVACPWLTGIINLNFSCSLLFLFVAHPTGLMTIGLLHGRDLWFCGISYDQGLTESSSVDKNLYRFLYIIMMCVNSFKIPVS